jgi:Flp pilus assembly secretin CpaC
MPKYTVTIEGNGIRKIVEVDTDGMSATMAEPANTATTQQATQFHQGGKRSAPSFRLKKRRVTRKLRKTR